MKKLKRSATDRRFLGICGGIGEYFGIDPVVVRIIWAVAIAFFGTGVMFYILMAIVMPEAYEENEQDYYRDYYRKAARKDVTPKDPKA